MKKISLLLTCVFFIALLAGRQAEAAPSAGDALSVSALAGRWGNSGVKYGFSDDSYFYKSTVLSYTRMSSIYHSETRRYSGDYVYITPGWWENTFTTHYTYLNTLFGRYTVRGGVIRFEDVISIPHSTFEPEWYRRETRGADDGKLLEKFQTAEFGGDFTADFEFISPTRIRLRDKSSDKDYFWDLDDVPHEVRIPTHVIPPAAWPAKAFSPEMPELKTKGRLREATLDEATSRAEEIKTTLIIDKTDSLTDIRGYVKTLRGAGWWAEEPEKDAESLNLEARKGMWRLGIKNGNGAGSNEDTVVIESIRYPEGKWPQAWSGAKLEPPQKSVIVGNVDNKPDESSKNIAEKLYFDKVNDKGVEDYAARLQQAGFVIPASAGDKWQYMKYIRMNRDLYRAQIEMESRHGDITAFMYDLKYFPDGVWPSVWSSGGLPAPEGGETIVGEIDMGKWDKKDEWYGGFSSGIKFLGLDQNKIDGYFKKLHSLGFGRKEKYDGKFVLYKYLRLGGSMCRVQVEQQENDELAEIDFSFQYFPGGVWPSVWRDGGLPAPEGSEMIVGEINMEKWDKKDEWYGSFSSGIKFLGLDQNKIDNYFKELQSVGFGREENSYRGKVVLYKYLRLGGSMCRVQVEQQENDELAEIDFSFQYFPDGEWPTVWRDGGLPAPKNAEAIVGAINMGKWDKKDEWYGSFSASVKFLGLDQKKIDNYFKELQSAGFGKEENYSDSVTLYKYLRLGGSINRVQIEQRENEEIVEIYYSFSYFEDGEWPSDWQSMGVPAPKCTAIVGAFDLEKWNDKGSWYETRMKFLGANLSDYTAVLKKNGFTEPEYARENWELEKRLRIGGVWYKVTIYDTGNGEIPEVSFTFSEEN
ncbi:MAG: hypothetical protein FWF87_08750 [Synergistaceae bacterium]|nr:hypothetical protein [Synergistaceae bacterium]